MGAEAEYDPSKYPTAELFWHVQQKGFQAGSLLGLVVGAPILAWRRKNFQATIATTSAAYGAIGGLCVSGIMGLVKYVNMDQDGLEDRVYRLHYSEGQNRVDLFSQVGSVVGAPAAAFLVGSSAIHILGGAAVGAAVGMVAHVLTAPKDMQTAKSLGKMYQELKR